MSFKHQSKIKIQLEELTTNIGKFHPFIVHEGP